MRVFLLLLMQPHVSGSRLLALMAVAFIPVAVAAAR